MAAITGLDSRILVGPIGTVPSGSDKLAGSPMALRSAPAQNVPPAPHSTATRASGSASKSANAATSTAAVGPSTALRTSGRSRTMVVTRPAWSTRTVIVGLADLPGVIARQQGGKVPVALLLACFLKLGRHQLVMAGPDHLPEQADRRVGEIGAVEPGEGKRVRRIVGMRIVSQQRIRIGLGHVHRLQRAVAAESQALAAARAELDGSAVLKADQVLFPRSWLGNRRERVIVEDRAVLVDLDERGTLVVGRGA